MTKPKDHTKPRGGIGRNRNEQPSSHEEEVKMKNPTTTNKIDTRLHKGRNQLIAPWHAASAGTDKVKSGEHALPRPPKKPGGMQGKVPNLLNAETIPNSIMWEQSDHKLTTHEFGGTGNVTPTLTRHGGNITREHPDKAAIGEYRIPKPPNNP